MIHRGAKIAEEHSRRRSRLVENTNAYAKYFKLDGKEPRQLSNIKATYVFAGNATSPQKNYIPSNSSALPIESKYKNSNRDVRGFERRPMSVVDGIHVRTPRFNLNVEAKAQALSPRQTSKRDTGESKTPSQANKNRNNTPTNKSASVKKPQSIGKGGPTKAGKGDDSIATQTSDKEKKQENRIESKKPSLKNRDFTPPRKSPKVENLMKRKKKTNAIDTIDDASSPATTTILVRVLSAGMHDGDTARIVCDNVDYSPNERGFNVVTLDAKTLSLLDARSFNTHDNDIASSQMAKYLLKLPVGTIVLIAVRTDATAHVSGECIRALKVMGARSFRRTWWIKHPGPARFNDPLLGSKGLQVLCRHSQP